MMASETVVDVVDIVVDVLLVVTLVDDDVVVLRLETEVRLVALDDELVVDKLLELLVVVDALLLVLVLTTVDEEELVVDEDVNDETLDQNCSVVNVEVLVEEVVVMDVLDEEPLVADDDKDCGDELVLAEEVVVLDWLLVVEDGVVMDVADEGPDEVVELEVRDDCDVVRAVDDELDELESVCEDKTVLAVLMDERVVGDLELLGLELDDELTDVVDTTLVEVDALDSELTDVSVLPELVELAGKIAVVDDDNEDELPEVCDEVMELTLDLLDCEDVE
mmetsp:Transcript_20382/g.46804  ORF Transcript_20382/g.46804 Transcript_20382/m.46804 type:complete len:278 (-) Transcript_20382:747-1580(-)